VPVSRFGVTSALVELKNPGVLRAGGFDENLMHGGMVQLLRESATLDKAFRGEL
jgi:hypothetical protein